MHGFLLGCSGTWDQTLIDAGLPPRHMELGLIAPMYRTTLPLDGVGPFQGTMVVSMRPYLEKDVQRVRAITSEFPECHGPPVFVGGAVRTTTPASGGEEHVSVPELGIVPGRERVDEKIAALQEQIVTAHGMR